MRKGFLLSLFCCLSSIASFAATYYYQGGTFTTAGNWNDNPVGGGGTPVDFDNAADVWVVTTTNALAINGAWTVAGSLQIDGTCTITVNPTISSGITVNSGGTLNQNIAATAVLPNMAAVQNGTIVYGTGNHTLPAGITYQNVTMNPTATVTASGDVTVNGTLTVNAAKTLAMSTFQLIAGTSFAITNSGTITTASTASQPIPTGRVYAGTVNYNGTDAQTVVAASYLNLTISGARVGTPDITLEPGTVRVGNGTTTAAVFTVTATGVGNYVTTGTTFQYAKSNGGQTIQSAIPYNNLSLQNTSGTQTANGNITVNGALSNAAGSFSLSTFQLLGTPTSITNTGTIATANTGPNPFPSGLNWGTAGAVSYASAGAQTIVTGTYFNMLITGNKGSNALTFQPGTFVLGGTTFTGSATNIGSYVMTGTTIEFSRLTGGATLFGLPIPYENLTFDNTSGIYTAGANLTVTGTLTTTAGGTLAMSTLQLLGTPTIAHSGIITTSNTSGTPIPSGLNWGTTGTVTFSTTTTNQTVPAGTYNNLTLSQTTGNATAAGNITVNGTLTTTTGSGGYFNLSTFDLIEGTAFAVANNGTIRTASASATPIPSGRSWSGTTGTVEYNGTGAQTVVLGTYKGLTLSQDRGTAAITLSSGTIDVTGNFSATATNVSYTTTGNTMRYTTLAGAQAVAAIPYSNLTFLNTSGTNTAGGNITVNGTLTTTAGGTFSLGTNQLLGTPTIVNNGTITTLNTGSTPLPSGLDWGASTGTVSYAATGATTIMAGTYNHLTITGAKGSNSITLESGNIVVNGTPTGGATGVSSYVTTGNTFVYNRLTGGTMMPLPITYNHLTVANTSGSYTLAASQNLSVSGDFVTAAGGTLALAANQFLATPASITHNGTITTTNTGSNPFPAGLDWTANGGTGTISYGGTTTATIVTGTYYNLTTTGAHAANAITLASGNITVNNTLNWGASTTTFVNTGNTLILNNLGGNGANINSTALTLNHLTLNNTSSSYKAGAGLVVNGTLTTTAGGTLDLQANQLLGTLGTINNNGIILTTTTLNPAVASGKNWGSSGEVVFARTTGGQSIPGGTYNDLTFSNTSGTQTAVGNITVNGDLTIVAAGILAMGANQMLGTPASVVNNGTITTANTSATPLPSGVNWGTTGLINFTTTTTNQTVPGGTYNNLTLAQTTGNATADGDITVNGTLITTTGTGGFFSLATHNLIEGTSLVVTNNGTIKTASTSATPVPSGINWSGTTGAFEYNGTAAQTIATGTYKTLTLSGDHGGANITLQGGTIDLTGNFSVTATNIGGYTNAGNTFRYTTLAGAQTIGGIGYNNLTLLNTSATNTAGADIMVTGTLTTTSGGTMAMGNFQMLGGPTSVSNGGTITSTNSGSTPFPSNVDWGSSGTVSYIGVGATTIVAGTYNNLSISGAHAGNNITLASGNIVINNLFTNTPTFTTGTWVNTGNTTVFNNAAGGITLGTVPVTFNHLSFNNTSGTYTAGADITVNGTLTTTAGGTLSFANVAYELLGTLPTVVNNGTIQTVCTVNPPIASGKDWGTTGEIIFSRTTGGQSIPAGTYNDLTFSNTSGTQTAVGNLTVNGDLTITATGTLAMGTNQMLGTPTSATNNGTITTANTSATPLPSGVNWGTTGLINFTTTTTNQTVPGGTYNNLTLGQTTGNATAGGDITVNGTLITTTGTGGYFSLATHDLIEGTSFALTNNGTIKTASTSATPVPSGLNWSGTTGAFEYNGTAAQTIATGTYKTLTLSGDHGGANITLQSGTTDLTGNFTVSATNVGGYTNTGNTFRYTTLAGAQTIGGIGYNHLTLLNTSATNTAGGNVTVDGTLTTTTGGTMAMSTFQLLGTPAVANNGTITTTNTGSNPFPSGLDWGSNGTVSYGGTSTATIVTGTYNNLTTTGAHVANAITLEGGNITVNNTLNWGASTTNFVNASNTLVLNNLTGSGSNINSTALTLNNLTLNNTSGTYIAGAALTVNGVLTSTAGGALAMGTNLLNLGGAASTSGTGTIRTANTTATPITASKTWTQTLEFNSASNQSIVAGTYGGLMLSSAGTKSVTGTVNVTGDLTLGASNTLNDGVNTVTVSGNILGTGTHTGTTGKIVMNGASGTISGATLRNLQLNNAAGFSLTGNPTITGTLTFTAGILDLGSNNLTFGTTGASATPSASSMIVTSGSGEVRRNYTANGSFTFPVGDNVGPYYSPITVNFTGGTYGGGAYAAAKVTKAVHPDNYSGVDYLTRYWTINTNAITSPVYTVTATYDVDDVEGTESLIYMGEYSSSTWTQHAVTNTGTHTLSTNANVTATSADFTGVGGPGVAVNSGSICPTGTVNLTATASTPFTPVTYSWTPNTNLSATTGATVTASPTVTTVYTVTATDAHGLTGMGTATVTVVSQPSVNIGLSSTGYICPTTVMSLTATPGGGTGTANYTWSGPGISGSPSSGAVASYTTIPSPSYTLIPTNAAGAYTVVLTYSGSGCQSVAATSTSISPAVHQWEGGASGDVNNWSNASNWVCGGVPAASDHILIPARSNQPTMLASTTSSIARLYVAGTSVLTMGASATLNVSGRYTNYGTITGPTTAKVVLNGSSAQTIGGSGDVFNIELNNASGATVNIVAGDTLIVKGTLTLTSGTLTTNGRVMLYADATTNGRIGEITGGTISGNIVTQNWFQTVGHKAWHFFSHPFDNYIALNMLCNSINMTGSGGSSNGWSDGASNEPSAYWINPGTGWVAFTNANASTAANQFKQHQGIRLFVWGNLGEGIWGGTTSTSVRMRLYGHPNMGTQNVVMTKAASGSAVDYNQVGNPFPSPVNIGQVIKDALDAGKLVGTSYWVWNPALGTSGQYVTKTIDGSAFYISSGNAFQIRTLTDGNTLIFNESHKGTTPSINLRTYTDGINLTVYDATYHPWDMLSVKFNQESTDGEEAVDAGKPEGPADLNFYSLSSDNIKLSSDVRPYAAGKVIPLGISSNVKSQFILKADKVAVPTGARVYLHDKLLNKYQLLTQGAEYPFSINENGMSYGDNRFELTMEELHAFDLHTKVSLEAALAPNPAVSEVSVSYTTSGAENTIITVADVSGHVLFTKDAGTARNGKVNVSLSNYASGVYLVTITSGDARIEKTLIKE